MGANDRFSRTLSREKILRPEPWKLSSLGPGGIGNGRLSPVPSDEEKTAAGYDAGKTQGYLDGKAEANRLLQQARVADMQRLEALLASLDREWHVAADELQKTVADHLLDLAIDIARQVIGHEVSVRPGQLLPLIQPILDQLSSQVPAPTIRLAPVDLNALNGCSESIKALQHCRLVADPAMAAGGCAVDTQQATIDASLQTRWRRVMHSLGNPSSGTDEPSSFPETNAFVTKE
jgi:flagellar assembly protein FliH